MAGLTKEAPAVRDNHSYRRGSQVVRQGSAKALCVGSIPTLASLLLLLAAQNRHIAATPAASLPALGRGDDLDSGNVWDGHGAIDGHGDLVGIGSAEFEGEQTLTEFCLGGSRQIGHSGPHIGEDNGLAEKRNRLLRGGRSGFDDKRRRERGSAGLRGWGW